MKPSQSELSNEAAAQVPKGKVLFGAWQRSAVLLVLYVVVSALSYLVAFLLRFDFEIPPTTREIMWRSSFVVVLIKLISLLLFRQYTPLLGYFGMPDLWRLVSASGTGSMALLIIYYTALNLGVLRELVIPRGVILTDFLLATVGFIGIRLGFRIVRERTRPGGQPTSARGRRVAIIGAGDVGGSLAKELLSKRGLGLVPVAFFDDDPGKWRCRLHGIPVVGKPELLLQLGMRQTVDEVIIAMPTAPARRIREIVSVLQRAHLNFRTVPSVDQLATGKVRVTQLRPVEIQDLLQREPVKLDDTAIGLGVRGRKVLVTGAGGSIGSELCRQLLIKQPQVLIMVDQSEVQLFEIEQELLQTGNESKAVPLIADVLDESRMRFIFDKYRPEFVFHAAAYKHVPMMESQPSEAIKNNTFATVRLAHLAKDYGVERFVLISTDKAINPTSVMGASKRLAEIYVQALSANSQNSTKYITVRFGNVLGSSGSVIPIFTKQIAQGGPVTVTHPEVTRYFMTIPEAVGLVLQAAFMGRGGEIYVLDMGRPLKILDLARQLIELSGLKPGEDIEIRFTGLRPGEKLFEEISHLGENYEPTGHPQIKRFVSSPKSLEEVQAFLASLEAQLHTAEANLLKTRITELVPEYKPYLS